MASKPFASSSSRADWPARREEVAFSAINIHNRGPRSFRSPSLRSPMSRILGRLALLVLTIAPALGDEPVVRSNADGLDFFEKRIRPLLADNCYQCHGAKKQESGLNLASSTAIRSGGDRGPPIAPGEPEQSLLIQAVRYTDDDLKMPPRGKL